MKVFVRVFFGFLLGGLLFFGGWFVFQEQLLKITAIQIVAEREDEPILFARIQDSLKNQYKPYIGQFFWEVKLEALLKAAESDKRVRQAHIVRHFPNEIVVRIEPHDTVAHYLDKKGLLHPIAADGSLLPALRGSEVPDRPIVRGKEVYEDEQLRSKVVQLLKELPIKGSFSQKSVSELHYSKKEGFEWFLSYSGLVIRTGDEATLGNRIQRVEQVLNYLDQQRVRGRVIDARFSKKVVVKPRNQP